MKTVALLSTSTKELRPKPAYVKPVHKTYRELLQLDRPRKKIEYESSSSEEEDFLEKLLAEENEKGKPKKRKKASKKAETVKSQAPSEKRNSKNLSREGSKDAKKG